MKPIQLEDLVPNEAVFSLSRRPNKVYTLEPFSLRARLWAKKRFGNELKKVFDNLEVESIAELAFYLLKSKADFEREGVTRR